MKRLIILACIFLFFLAHGPAFAAENFTTSSEVTYTVKENGMTHAEFNTTLTNITSKHYASSYKSSVGFENVENIRAWDAFGGLETKVDKTFGKTTIEILFNRKVVGINKQVQFNFSFDTPDILQNQENVKELSVPGIENGTDYKKFNVHVKVPTSFGDPVYVKPSVVQNLSAAHLDFTIDQLKKSGISIAFGQKQVYEFTLQYNLKNTNFFPIKTEIALPPSTNYQDIFFDSITPKPIQVTQDQDGNWLAQYQLKPTEKQTIIVTGIARVSLDPKREKVADSILLSYLKQDKYWETNASEIKKLSQQLKTPEDIYNYVVKTLHYDFSRVSSNKPRLGAQEVLRNPNSAVCLEFTDLFIALARAAGIPAREVDGFANTQNLSQRPLSKTADILHAWPQYYDKALETWVMVDPTWGNTTGGVDYFNTLDFDHFALVIRGKNSQYPIPAGGYKFAGKESEKNVLITVSKKDPQAIFDSKAELSFEKAYMAFFPIEGHVVIHNNGNTLLPSQSLHVSSEDLTPHGQDLLYPDIPPYGYAVLPVAFDKTPFLTNKKVTLTIQLGNRALSHDLIISPFVINKNTITGGALVSGTLGCIIYIIARRTRRVSIS